MRRSVFLSILPLLISAVACNDHKPSPGDAGDEDVATDEGDGDGDVPPAPGFVADAEPSGAALYASVDMTDPAAPVVTVWAARLGSTFGIAFHVAFDDAVLSAHDPAAATSIGLDAAGEARYLAVAKPGDVVFGAARRGAEAGGVDISDPVAVVTIPLAVLAPGATRIDIVDAQVRRADGSFVLLGIAGGTLTTGGEP